MVEIWQSQPASCGFAQQISVSVFEHFVLAKPYFDRRGLLIAEEAGKPIGFVHAAFGANENRTEVSHDVGLVCMLQVRPEFDSDSTRSELLAAAEEYLRAAGARRIIGGPSPPHIPFYHGLCGSGELPGIMRENDAAHAIFQSEGYSPREEFAVMDCDLTKLRPTVDRTQRQLSWKFEVRPTMDHVFDNWWETCAFGPIQRSLFEIIDKATHLTCGSMLWWDLEISGERQSTEVALSRVVIEGHHRRTGLATFLVSNALKQLKSSGATLAQVQVALSNEPGLEFFRKLGFSEVRRGTSYEKKVG